MKKQTPKLTLHRETLRNLSPTDLDQVAGGGPTTGCTTSDYCTLTCNAEC